MGCFEMRRVAVWLCGMLLLLALAAASAAFFSAEDQPWRGEGLLTVHYLDVGQSDCTFVEVGGEYTLMIDTADEAHADDVCRYVGDLGYDRIDVLVLTHPHSDHIGGAERIFGEFDVGCVYMTEGDASGEDADYLSMLLAAVREQGTPSLTAGEGVSFELGALTGVFLSPTEVRFDDENEMSAVLSLRYGERRFLFSGDIGEDAERMLVQRGAELSASVVTAGHHGSGGSSSREFVRAAGAEYVIISCGEGNDYGHPSPYTVDRWESEGARAFRTDRDSDVIAYTDGDSLTVLPRSAYNSSDGTSESEADSAAGSDTAEELEYLLNTSSHRIHHADCSLADEDSENVIGACSADIDRLMAEGYRKCSSCFE